MSVTREATAADAVIWTAAGMALREARFVSRRETFIVGITRIVNIGITLRIDTKANSVVAAQSNGGQNSRSVDVFSGVHAHGTLLTRSASIGWSKFHSPDGIAVSSGKRTIDILAIDGAIHTLVVYTDPMVVHAGNAGKPLCTSGCDETIGGAIRS
jgi:hypothetical protein